MNRLDGLKLFLFGHKYLSTRDRNERELKLKYLKQVFVEYHRLPELSRNEVRNDLPASVAQIVGDLETGGELTGQNENRLDWNDIAVFESKVLAKLDDAALRRRAWVLRAQFARLVGPERYQQYKDSEPPDHTDSKEALLADLTRLLGLFHWIYSMTLVRESMRRRILKRLWGWTLGITLAGLAVSALSAGHLSWDSFKRPPPLAETTALVLTFGAAGAYISALRRLQQGNDGVDPVIGALGLAEFYTGARFAIFAGAIFAAVVWLLMMGGFLQGTLFPALKSFSPESSTDWAKLLIWSFIAGFAERLVPDTLDRLVNSARVDSAARAAEIPNVKGGAGVAETIPADVQRVLDEFGVPKEPASTDTNRGRFGGKADDGHWKISAQQIRLPSARQVIQVHLVVERSGVGTDRYKKARFSLSLDFTKKREAEVDVNDQAFLFSFYTYYPFVVGVELLPGGRKLELDLAQGWPP